MNIIYNEDCLETMKRDVMQNNIDVIITSPPYNTSRVGDSDKYASRYDLFEDSKTDDEYLDWTINIFNGYNDILKENGCILYNLSYSSENTHLIWFTISAIIQKTNFTVADTIVWKKKNALPNNTSKNKLTRIVEYIFVFVRKDEYKTFHTNKKITSTSEKTGQDYYENIMNFIEARNNDGSNKLNKATFSTELVSKLLDIYAKPNSIIYDSFIGIGTTAKACIEKDLKYIGSEISKEQIIHFENWKNNKYI